MDRKDSPAGSPETADTTSEGESDEGYLSRLRPYVQRGTQSGAIAAAVGVGTFLRALGSLVRRNWGRAVTRLTVAAAWITVAVLQRQNARERPVAPDRTDVESPIVPKMGGEAEPEGGETAIEIDEPGAESEGADEPFDEIGAGDEEADPVEPVSEELEADEEEREIAVDADEESEEDAPNASEEGEARTSEEGEAGSDEDEPSGPE